MSAVPEETVAGILAEDLDTVWHYAGPLVQKALEYADGKLALEDAYQSIKAREMQLWLPPGGVWVTRIVCYPRSKRLESIAAAGEWRDWLKHGDVVLAWAKEQGCDAVELIGRPGWGRRTGFEEIHRVFRVRI
jgi:hypothetical protein